jgi:hypothetical protein
MTQYIWIFVYKVLNMVCFLSQYIKYTAQTVFYDNYSFYVLEQNIYKH